MSTIFDRRNLFVFDPNPFIEKSIAKSEKDRKEGFEKIKSFQEREQKYINDIYKNIGDLKDQASSVHNLELNQKVNDLLEKVKGNMTKKGKFGFVSFNYNDPSFQNELQQDINKIKNFTTQSKVAQEKYDELLKKAKDNPGILKDGIGLVNSASSLLMNSAKLESSNSIAPQFDELYNNEISPRLYLKQVIDATLESGEQSSVFYSVDTKDGKSVTVETDLPNILYDFNKETGLPILDANGKPALNLQGVANLQKEIKKTLANTDIDITSVLENEDGSISETFIDLIRSNRDIKEKDYLNKLNIKLAETRVAKAKKDLEDEKTTSLSDRFTVTSFKTVKVGGDEVQDNVRIHQFAESKVIKDKATDGLIQGQDIKAINGIGHNVLGEKVVYLTGINGKKIAIKEGTKLVDIVDAKDLSEDLKKYILTKEDILSIYNLARDSYYEKLDAKEKDSFIDVLERTKLFDVTDRNPIGINFGEEQDE